MNKKIFVLLGLASFTLVNANSRADQVPVGTEVECPAVVCTTFYPSFDGCKPSEFLCRQSGVSQDQVTAFDGHTVLILNKDGSNLKKIPMVSGSGHYSPAPYSDHSSVILHADGGYTFIQTAIHWVKDASDATKQHADPSKHRVLQIDTVDANLNIVSSLIPTDGSGQTYDITDDQVSVTADGQVQIKGNNGQTLQINPKIDQNALEQTILKIDIADRFGENFEKSYYALNAQAASDTAACSSQTSVSKIQKCQEKVQTDLQKDLEKSAKAIVKAKAKPEDANAEYFYAKNIQKKVPTVADLYSDAEYLRIRYPYGKVYSYALTLDGTLIIQGMSGGFQGGGGISAAALGSALIGQTLEKVLGTATPNVDFASPYTGPNY